MATVSLSEAARAVGKSKPTLLKALKDGRLKGVKGNREWRIDTADLFQVWPKLTERADTPTSRDDAKIAALETEVRMLREIVELERETVTDLRARLDKAEADLSAQRARPKWWPFG